MEEGRSNTESWRCGQRRKAQRNAALLALEMEEGAEGFPCSFLCGWLLKTGKDKEMDYITERPAAL